MPNSWTIREKVIVEKLINNEKLGQDYNEVGRLAEVEHCSIFCILIVQMFLNIK